MIRFEVGWCLSLKADSPGQVCPRVPFASRPEFLERLAVELVRPAVVRPEPQSALTVFINREHFNRGLAFLDGVADFLFPVVLECTRRERPRPELAMVDR